MAGGSTFLSNVLSTIRGIETSNMTFYRGMCRIPRTWSTVQNLDYLRRLRECAQVASPIPGVDLVVWIHLTNHVNVAYLCNPFRLGTSLETKGTTRAKG